MVAVPTRTCIGCRQRAAAADLVRLVLVEGRPTPRGRAGPGGRGASIHPREACVVAAIRTHAFARAFRGPVSPFPGASSAVVGRTAAAPDGRKSEEDDALRAFIKDIEVAHVLQQPRAGRTP